MKTTGTQYWRKSLLSRDEANRVVAMTAAEWAAHEAALVAAHEAAYGRYHGVMPAHGYRAGSPQCIGHGSMVGGFVGQEEWVVSRDRLDYSRSLRTGTQWRVTVAGGIATFAHVGLGVRPDAMGRGYAVEVVTHGVDVSGCRTPAEAVEAVRAAYARVTAEGRA